jgi:hypothetical protein
MQITDWNTADNYQLQDATISVTLILQIIHRTDYVVTTSKSNVQFPCQSLYVQGNLANNRELLGIQISKYEWKLPDLI